VLFLPPDTDVNVNEVKKIFQNEGYKYELCSISTDEKW